MAVAKNVKDVPVKFSIPKNKKKEEEVKKDPDMPDRPMTK